MREIAKYQAKLFSNQFDIFDLSFCDAALIIFSQPLISQSVELLSLKASAT